MRILHQRTGHDFKNYKRATVLRRLERRLQVRALPDLVTYKDFLASEPHEATALLDDMLIGVTQFFRDRAAFEGLERDVVPKLFEAVDDQPVRAWVAGCSTGEEAYSIAMLLAEESRRVEPTRKFTVFATDIDEGGDHDRPRQACTRSRSPPTCRRRACATSSRASRTATASTSRCASR